MKTQKHQGRKRHFHPALDQLEDRVLLTASTALLVVAPDAGEPPHVKVYDAETGQLHLNFRAYEASFTGGVRVATGDVTGDGVPDIITGKGPGSGSRVRVFDGVTGNPLSGTLGSFQAYGAGQSSGVFVAAGDVDGDGHADIITGTETGAAPIVKVFSGLDGSVLATFTVGKSNSTTGVRVAAGDVNGDGLADIVTGEGPGGRPRVCVYDGATGTELYNFFAFEYAYRGGVYVAAGDVTGDGKADIVVGPGQGHAPEVRVYHGADTAHLGKFLAYGNAFTGGVRVATVDADGDGKADIVAAPGAPGNQVRVFDGQDFARIDSFRPFGNGLDAGLFVGGSAPAADGISTFDIDPVINVSAIFPSASEDDIDGQFSFTGMFLPMEGVTVTYTISGTASSGADFQTLSGSVTIPWSTGYATVDVTVLEDAFIEGAETVIVTIEAGSGYDIGSQASATVTITDNEPGQGDTPPPLLPDTTLCQVDVAGKPLPYNGPSSFSAGPVRYFDGTLHLQQTDLVSLGFGEAWGITRSWSNHSAYSTNSLGSGETFFAEMPTLFEDENNSIILVSNSTTGRFFDYNFLDSTYTARYHLQETLTHSTSAKEFTFTDLEGNRIVFHDFDASLPSNKKGQLKKYTVNDAAGIEISVTSYTGEDKPAEIERSVTVGSDTITESYVFTYVTSGVATGEFSNILQRRKINSGSWTTIRQVDYAYYDGTVNDGTAGDLKTATIKDASGNTIDVWYYRYYKADEAGGYAGGLQFAFSPASYERLKAVYSDPASATDTQVAPYADLFFEYNAAQMVSKEIVQGAGCSSCTGGLGEYLFEYSTSGFAEGHNSWSRKAVETLPDGNQNIVYLNFAGEVMLKVFKDVTLESEWINFYKYDDDGRLIWSANPSAVSGYDEERPDLLDLQSSNYQYLRDSEGAIEVHTYAATTTAGSGTGDVAGRLKKVELKHGESGTAILQSEISYYLTPAFDFDLPYPAVTTNYRNADGTGGQSTTFTYTWNETTATIVSLTVTLPVVGTDQNGPGSADVSVTFFDTYGQPTWHKDGDGFLHYTAYDMATGAVTKSITDVNTANTGDFTGLPSGWSTPSGGGLHLIAQFEVDGLGRATKVTTPAGNIDYIVYKDTSHEVRYYPGWNTGTDLPTGPTQVVREDRAGGYFETLTMSATPSVTSSRPDGTESIGSLETLVRSTTNTAWQVTGVDAYFNLSGLTYSTSASLGTENTHYYRTAFGYDSRGRRNKVIAPTGTIYKTEFDSLGRTTATKVGTSDGNLVQTAEYVYDAGGVGDSNLTETTQFPGGGAADRVSEFYYDWRNRLVAAKTGVEGSESSSLNRPIAYFEYDNLDQMIAAEQYDGDNVTIVDGNSDGVPDKPSSSLRRARSTASFDDQGRVYRTNTFSVSQSDGSVSSTALQSDVWFGRRGQVLKSSSPGGLVTKAAYDGAGRVVKSYVTDGGGDSAWSDADDVTGDVVLEQSETTYDANSNPILVTQRQRFHDETATGALVDPSTAPKARVSYAAAYYDKADRLTDSVNVGTNGSSSYTRPSTVPSRSDTVLVSSYTFNSAGWVSTTTDPRGLEDRLYYDNLGRTTKTIEAYVDGTPDGGSDRTVEFTYDGANHPLTLKAYLTATTYQTTQYVYGVTTSTSGLYSNDLLAEMRYPDKSSGDASSTEKEIYTYNALGQPKTKQDRNGNVHTFSFDVVGRMTSDAVTTLGSGVDGTVRRAEIAYDTAGRPYLFTNYDAASSGNVVNQVQREFNGLGQLTKEYQAHSGAVNTGSTPKVQYGYSEMVSSANHSRPTTLIYPNGRDLDYNYASGVDAAVSRLTSISDNSTTLESLSYIGVGTVVRRAHPEPGVDLTYIKQSGESNGDAGDQYTGLDRFGQVVDQRWIKTSSGTATDRFKYGHDRNGNRLYRENVIDAAFSELYHADGSSAGYDNFGQLTDFQRGTLSDTNSDSIPDTVSSASRYQSWTLDAQGNWSSLNTDGTSVSRTHNKQNQVTVVGSANLTFDANGNLTTDQNGQQYVFDAWNRLVTVKNSGSTTIASYQFDALGRRIVETVSSTTKDLYFSAAWQVLEERVGSDVKSQYVWSPVYVDALILRDRDADANSGNGLEERLYVQQDANFNVTALIDSSGTVVERYIYDPYGVVTALPAGWTGPVSGAYQWEVLHQGGRYEFVTGLYNFRNRELHPTLGRWVQVDPLGFGAGDTNWYRAEGGNPTTGLDPSGLQASLSDRRGNILAEIERLNRLISTFGNSPTLATQLQYWLQQLSQFDRDRETAMNMIVDPPPIHVRPQPLQLAHTPQSLAQQQSIAAGNAVVGNLVASTIPGVGEGMDWAVIISPHSTWGEWWWAAGSLLLSVVTVGASPNAGAVIHGAPNSPHVPHIPNIPHGASDIAATQTSLTTAAQQAHVTVGAGSGPVHGTHVHSAFQNEVQGLGNPSLLTEVSYLNGVNVVRGTPGSVRLDVVQGTLNAPTAIFDLKTGSAVLTPERIRQIRQHLPPGCENIPVIEIR